MKLIFVCKEVFSSALVIHNVATGDKRGLLNPSEKSVGLNRFQLRPISPLWEEGGGAAARHGKLLLARRLRLSQHGCCSGHFGQRLLLLLGARQ